MNYLPIIIHSNFTVIYCINHMLTKIIFKKKKCFFKLFHELYINTPPLYTCLTTHLFWYVYHYNKPGFFRIFSCILSLPENFILISL